ncbi:MAG: hypothetical protein M5R36_17965 [Deltaproteobacteria bacterium]|nr:hypothetical protein [Deltaproteobacteria bacterium]
MFFPLKNLGLALGAVAALIPIALGLDGLRQICLPGFGEMNFLSIRTEIVALFLMTNVFGIASVHLLRRMERKGLIDGTLTEKWL